MNGETDFRTSEGVRTYVERLLCGPFRCRERWFEDQRFREFLHNGTPIARYQNIRVFGGDFGDPGVTRPLRFRERSHVLASIFAGGGLQWHSPFIDFNGLRLYLDELSPHVGVEVELLDPYPGNEEFAWWDQPKDTPAWEPTYLLPIQQYLAEKDPKNNAR